MRVALVAWRPLLGGALPAPIGVSAAGSTPTRWTSCDAWPPISPRACAAASRCYPATPQGSTADGPGIIILDTDLAVVSINPRGRGLPGRHRRRRLAGPPRPAGDRFSRPPPHGWPAITTRGHPPTVDPAAAPRRRLDHRARLTAAGRDASRQVAVVLDSADTRYVSSLILAAHGLTAGSEPGRGAGATRTIDSVHHRTSSTSRPTPSRNTSTPCSTSSASAADGSWSPSSRRARSENARRKSPLMRYASPLPPRRHLNSAHSRRSASKPGENRAPQSVGLTLEPIGSARSTPPEHPR